MLNNTCERNLVNFWPLVANLPLIAIAKTPSPSEHQFHLGGPRNVIVPERMLQFVYMTLPTSCGNSESPR